MNKEEFKELKAIIHSVEADYINPAEQMSDCCNEIIKRIEEELVE